jgi:hypothetical protein
VANYKPQELPVGDIPEQHLTDLLASYPDLTKTYPSSWLLWNEKGKYKLHLKEVCHANMRDQDGPGWDDLISAVPRSDKKSLAYQRMLIHGPFKAFSDLVQLRNYPLIAKDEAKDKLVRTDRWYYHFTNLEDWPANVLYNFVIASRIPMEKQEWLAQWAKNVETGFNPTLAFLLSFSTNGKAYAGKRFDHWVSNHNWFDNLSNWSSIINGDMIKMSASFKVKPSACAPCNIIWGHDAATQKFAQMTDEEVSQHLGLPIEPPAADPPKPAARPKHGAKFYGNMLDNVVMPAPHHPWHNPNFAAAVAHFQQIQDQQVVHNQLQDQLAAQVNYAEPNDLIPPLAQPFNQPHWAAAPPGQLDPAHVPAHDQPDIDDEDDDPFHFDEDDEEF